jgi:hypothetical protein
MEEMLRFAALHGVRPAVEVLPFEQINEALERVRTNQARFRMVDNKVAWLIRVCVDERHSPQGPAGRVC